MPRDKFLSYLKNEKRYSPLTVTAYTTDLTQFYNFIKAQYDLTRIEEVTHGLIRSWIVDMIDAGITTRSVNRKITTLKSYYKFLLREGIVKKNPMLKILPPKTSKKLPVFVEKSSMDELLDTVDFDEGGKGRRDKLIILLLYSTGIRLSELINLKVSDIDFNKGTLKILGKGNKERILPFSDNLKNEIKQYLDEVCPIEWLFLTDKGKKLYAKLVYRLVNSYLRKVTTISKKSPHVLRHTFATHMLNNGADLNAIKEFLGHVSLSATQVYTHNTIKKLTNIYKQAHPKA
ncbi:MAG TPA: integrase [Flavobacteriales bacterium]|nr:integrase [Flavobacteriales bacterium]HIO72170.1 integrase [Flavobacteriales bacterium]